MTAEDFRFSDGLRIILSGGDVIQCEICESPCTESFQPGFFRCLKCIYLETYDTEGSCAVFSRCSLLDMLNLTECDECEYFICLEPQADDIIQLV